MAEVKTCIKYHKTLKLSLQCQITNYLLAKLYQNWNFVQLNVWLRPHLLKNLIHPQMCCRIQTFIKSWPWLDEFQLITNPFMGKKRKRKKQAQGTWWFSIPTHQVWNCRNLFTHLSDSLQHHTKLYQWHLKPFHLDVLVMYPNDKTQEA